MSDYKIRRYSLETKGNGVYGDYAEMETDDEFGEWVKYEDAIDFIFWRLLTKALDEQIVKDPPP